MNAIFILFSVLFFQLLSGLSFNPLRIHDLFYNYYYHIHTSNSICICLHILYTHIYMGGRLCVFCSSLLQDQNIRSWRDLIKNTQCSGGGDKGSGSKQLNDFKTSQKLVIFTRPFPSQAYVSSKNHWGTFWDKLSFLEDSQTSWAAWRKQKLAKLLRRGSKQLSYQARTLSNLLCYLEIV